MANTDKKTKLDELFANAIGFDDGGTVNDIDIASIEDGILENYGLSRETVDSVHEMERDVEESYARATLRGGIQSMRENADIGLIEHRVDILGRGYGLEIVRPKAKDGKITRSNFRAGIGIYSRSKSNDFLDSLLDEAEEAWGDFAD